MHGCTPYLKRNYRHGLVSMPSCTGPDASCNTLSSRDRPPWCQPMAADLKQSQANEGRFPAQQGWTAAGACLGSQ
jgi:hypothetical protein